MPDPNSAMRFGANLDIMEWLEKLAEERSAAGLPEDAVNLCAAAIWLRDARRQGFKLRAIDPITGRFKDERGTSSQGEEVGGTE